LFYPPEIDPSFSTKSSFLYLFENRLHEVVKVKDSSQAHSKCRAINECDAFPITQLVSLLIHLSLGLCDKNFDEFCFAVNVKSVKKYKMIQWYKRVNKVPLHELNEVKKPF